MKAHLLFEANVPLVTLKICVVSNSNVIKMYNPACGGVLCGRAVMTTL